MSEPDWETIRERRRRRAAIEDRARQEGWDEERLATELAGSDAAARRDGEF